MGTFVRREIIKVRRLFVKMAEQYLTYGGIPNQEQIIDVKHLDKPYLDKDDKIGHGGFNDIYKNRLLGMEVALKVTVRHSLKAKFDIIDECEILRQLNHPNIIRFFGKTIID